jgi:hypothetical protein
MGRDGDIASPVKVDMEFIVRATEGSDAYESIDEEKSISTQR